MLSDDERPSLVQLRLTAGTPTEHPLFAPTQNFLPTQNSLQTPNFYPNPKVSPNPNIFSPGPKFWPDPNSIHVPIYTCSMYAGTMHRHANFHLTLKP